MLRMPGFFDIVCNHTYGSVPGVFDPLYSNEKNWMKFNEILILSTVTYNKISLDFIGRLHYYHGSKILVWNLLAWYLYFRVYLFASVVGMELRFPGDPVRLLYSSSPHGAVINLTCAFRQFRCCGTGFGVEDVAEAVLNHSSVKYIYFARTKYM